MANRNWLLWLGLAALVLWGERNMLADETLPLQKDAAAYSVNADELGMVVKTPDGRSSAT